MTYVIFSSFVASSSVETGTDEPATSARPAGCNTENPSHVVTVALPVCLVRASGPPPSLSQASHWLNGSLSQGAQSRGLMGDAHNMAGSMRHLR